MTETPAHVSSKYDTAVVVDFGAQYAQLIARRVRELHVYSEIVPHSITAAEVAAKAPKAIILSGGPKSVHVEGAPVLDPAIYDLGIPVFGICYGAQLIAQQLGGEVGTGMRGEYGRATVERTDGGTSSLMTAELPEHQPVWMSHFDAITRAPEGFVATGSTPDAPRRRAGVRRATDLRRAVPPRGRPLAVRHERAAHLPPRSGGLRAELDHGLGHRDPDRSDPRAVR